MLQTIVALDAWNEIAVLQHAPWLGRLLVASLADQLARRVSHFGVKRAKVVKIDHFDLTYFLPSKHLEVQP